jgi:hypothetical protein
MGLAAFPTFGSVIAGAPSAFGRRLQSPAINDCGSRAFLEPFSDPKDGAQVMDE